MILESMACGGIVPLGLDVISRHHHARSLALGDRRSPIAFTPCLMLSEGDPSLEPTDAPFSMAMDRSTMPRTMEISMRAPLDPPFEEISSPLRAFLGRTLPPSMSPAALGDNVADGRILPVSWTRLHTESNLADHSPDIIVLVDAPQLVLHPARFVKAMITIRETWPSALIHAPGVSGADTMALLTFLGADLHDTARCRVSAVSGSVIDTFGPREGQSDESSGELLSTSVQAMLAEARTIRAALARGEMRALVESRASSSPRAMEMLRFRDGVLASSDTCPGPLIVRSGRRFEVAGGEVLHSPSVRDWHVFIDTCWHPPSQQTRAMVLLPCSATKPYTRSPSHAAFRRRLHHPSIHEMVVTSPLGLVPRELEMLWPAAHYEVPVSGRWSHDERDMLCERLAQVIERVQPEVIIDHALPDGLIEQVKTRTEHAIHIQEYTDISGSGNFISSETTVIRTLRPDTHPTAETNLDLLEKAGLSVIEELNLNRPSGRELALEQLRSVARRLHGSDAWMDQCSLSGRPPQWRVCFQGHEVAEWLPNRGRFAFRASGLSFLGETKVFPIIELRGDVILRGDVFAGMILDTPNNLREGQDVIIMSDEQVVGMGRVVAPGWECARTPGVQVKVTRRMPSTSL